MALRRLPPALLLCLLCAIVGSLAQDPLFDPDGDYSATVNQNEPSNSLLATVSCAYSGDLRYEILTVSPSSAPDFLTIHPISGEITLTMNASILEVQNYTVSLRCRDVTDLNLNDLTLFTVTRVEENEFPPLSSHGDITVSIPESRDPDSFVVQVNATDRDLGTFGTVEYSIEGGSDNPFTVDSSSGIVSLQSSLDYESRNEYVFIVTASNPPVPESGFVRSADALVTVQVTNVNDESPEFTESNYQVTVHETWVEEGFFRPSPGFLVIECTDDDTDQADITYAISQLSDPGPFSLDASTGSFSVTEDLDFETRISYSFTVMCFDNGSPNNLSESALVDVSVSSLNEFIPDVVSGITTRLLQETTTVGTILYSTIAGRGTFGQYEVTDGDDGPDGTLTYTLTDDEESRFFSVDLDTGDLSVAQELDVDDPNNELISSLVRAFITACDIHPPREVCPNIEVRFLLRPANEFTPMFSQSDYSISVPESVGASTTILTATCTDGDIGFGEFSSISYVNPTADVENDFFLDGSTGEVITAVPLDFEMNQIYGFELRCVDSEGLEDRAVVQIEILPENDNLPSFERNSYTFQVSRTTPPNRFPIGVVVASDADVGFGGDLQYSIEANGFFDITNDGVIELFASVFNHTSTSINFEVFVTDSQDTDDALVVIQLTDGNLNRPEFVLGSRAVQVSELSPPGTDVHSVLCNDTDTGINGEIRYFITSGNTDDAFGINSVTGEITVASVLVLPQNVSEEVYLLEVQCQDRGVPVFSDEAVIIVRVFQDDSSPPEIGNETIIAFISEDAGINDPVITIEATDLDSSRLSFRLENESIPNIFQIDPSSGTVFVAVTGLDRETVSMYTMRVVVTEVRDPGSAGPERSDNATLTIFIRDVNDNTPQCEDVAAVTVPETLSPGSPIVQLSCSDPDFGDNGNITYSLSNDFGVLLITAEGNIVLENSFDLTDQNTLVFGVIVADQGTSPQENTYQVTIFISSINRNTPMFTNLPESIMVSEAQPIQEVIFTAQATDPDRGSFGEVRYEIVNSEENEPFTIFPNTGGIILTQKLNFFEQQEYTLNISASDSDFTVIETLTVEVLDANEFVPECVSTFVTASIPEGLTAPQLLSSGLSCSDDDEGSNGEIVFSILSGNHGDAFEVLSDGSIRTQVTLDFEDIDRYELQIQVSDSGGTPFSLNATVIIVVMPVNEFSPVFQSAMYTAEIPEGAELGRSVIEIVATDNDRATHAHGQVTYLVLELSEPLFSISSTGVLQVAGTIDREEEDFYSFTIQASDQGQPPNIATVTVEITILDLDDSSPVFSETLYVASLNRTTEVGTPVLTVNCSDPDLGMNAAVAYSFSGSSSDATFFEIQNSGLIEVREELPISRTYSFIVICMGLGPTPNFTDTATVSVQVFVESNITFYPSSSYSETLREDLSPVFTVLLVNATSSTGATLTYTLLNEGTPFSIDVTNGFLRLIASLDYEATRSYSLDIQASDNGEPPNIALALVQILVENVNDGEPQITTEPATITLSEGLTAIPHVVDIYECTDTDLGPFGQTRFRIESGNEGSIFTLSEIGTLRLTGGLDYETTQSYTLQLVCEDGGMPPREDTITIPIIVSPENDNPPQFQDDEITIFIEENLLINVAVGPPIQASDADLPPHSDLRYSVISGNDDQTFAISSTTGQITLVQSLDFETVSSYILVIEARDSGGQISPSFEVLNDTLTVNVMVLDHNDNEPQLSQTVYTGTILESAAINDVVVLADPISCSDIDSDENGETSLHITNGNTNNAFAIQETGIMTVQLALDFEVQRRYQLSVECRDNGSPQLASQATVIISVIDTNEHRPIFNQSTYMFGVPETTLVGTEIGQVFAVDQDAGETGVIMYALNATDAPFTIDSSTGAIILSDSLDYETQNRLYFLEVNATDSEGLDAFANLIIEVQNSDDNRPVFTQEMYFASVSEVAELGTFVTQVSCSDADDQADGIPIQYAFVQTITSFQLDSGRINVAESLDLETIPRYSFQITCMDSAGNTATTTVTIDLEPFNDFPPVFTGDLPYSVGIVENLPIGLSVFQATAADDDNIMYGDITFSFISGNEEGRFDIESDSGIITVSESIDREQQSNYTLVISAENVILDGDTSGSPSLSATTTLTIGILDLNDNDPTLNPGDFSIFISESNSFDVVVAEFRCSDPDFGANGTTSFSITSESTADLFEVYDNGTLVTTDFIMNNVVVEVTCSDSGSPPHTSSTRVTVETTSMNDHAPRFNSSSFGPFFVPEDYPVGEDIVCFTASDEDGSGTPDGTIRYALDINSGDVDSFSIRSDTGCLFVSIALDFDTETFYRYTIDATDLGDPPLTGSATLFIFVRDAISDPPAFVGGPYTRVVSEGVQSETFIAETTCEDPDEDDTISYNIINGNSAEIFFINNETGIIEIALNQRLDFETATSHVLTVECTDSNDLSDSANVFITVTAVNEFTPAFQPKAVSVPEHSIGGTLVTQLESTDNDAGPDGEVTFNITRGNTGNAFLITDDGRILVRGDLDRESLDFYNLEIRISDLTEDLDERRSSMNNISVTIADINDHAPVFDSDPYVFGPLAGNELVGYFIGVVRCTDDDVGFNAEVTYEIEQGSGGTSLFDVDRNTGNLTLGGDLDTRQFDNITFFVECADGGSRQMTGTTRVLITVEEINQHAPVFDNSSYVVVVPEDTRIIDDIILTVNAEDSDSGVNGQIHYSLVDDFENLFFIDQDTGELSLLRMLDFENEIEYLLVVRAVDGAQDSPTRMTSTANVTVQVIGVNEFDPDCLNPVYVVVINDTTDGEILDLDCIDSDAGSDGMLVYNITSGDGSGLFMIADGILSIPNPIMPDTNSQQYPLEITVSDSGMPSRQTQVEVIVIYSFENTASPTFDQPIYNLSVSENIAVGEIVGTFTATDPDPSLQGQVTYSVTGTDSFRIDPTTGNLYVSRPLDHESAPSVEFRVVAQDSDPFAPLSGSTTVNITVLNEDDNSPQCDMVFFSSVVLSNSQVGDTVIVLTFSCLDPDGGQLMFELVSGGKRQASSFDIEPTTGRIFVTGPLTPSSTTVLTVRVSDEGGQITEVTVSIQVMFANVEPPVFPEDEYTLSVAEDTPLLSIIGSIPATDADSNSLDLRYSIVNADQTPQFYINPNTADILLTVPLDHETRQQYSFTVMVQDRGSYNGSNQLSDTATITVNVNNTNDNLPMFSNTIYGTTVSESTGVGVDVLSISCTDADTPPFASPTISSTGFAGIPFELAGSGGMRFVRVSGVLESRAYFINITCTDAGGLSTEGQVFIFVPEPNAPLFSEPVYEWVLSENTEVGEEFTNIEATSNDGSDVSYAITEGNEDDVFYINPDSGVVQLVSSLDYERQRTHGLIIRAADGVNRQSSVLLIVEVLDENDEVPLTPPSTVLQLSQNAPVGHPVGTLECSDGDSNPNATMFNFTFIPASDLFSVDEYGVVRLEGTLDDTPVYVLPVTCFDVNMPRAVSTGIVTIEIEFVNQYQPEFELDTYTFSIREDAEVLSLVGTVQASDRDVGSYGELSYAITEGNPNKFYIEAATGRIGLLTSLDRESVESYLITVVATDGGLSAPDPTRMTGTTVVSILVEDTNDNPPIPDQASYVQSITTNHTLFTPVLRVQCTDPDLSRGGEIEYTVDPAIGQFAVQNNGTIILTREQSDQAVYNFQVVCTDRGTPMLSSSALVTVIVDFVELEAPEFDRDRYEVTISENEPISSTILQVHATPSDSSIDIVYSIESGNDGNHFHVDPISGDIIIISTLDASVQQYYTLTIEAANTGRHSLSSIATVDITVTDINDNSPTFLIPFYPTSVNESAILLTPVIQVECTDPDVNAEITYEITDGLTSPVFNITQEGLIAVAGEIDYEDETVYTLEITCNDGGDSPRTARATVRIEVLALNEFVPIFSQPVYQFTAPENSFGTLIGRVSATDNDAGSQGEITYHLQDPGNFLVVFVEPSTGDILVANNLDYETQSFWNLTVIARDGDGAESHAFLEITVANINDVDPEISPLTSITTVSADSPVGYPVQPYTCSDADGSETTISITNGNTRGFFNLNEFNQLVWTGIGSNLTSSAVVSLTLQCQDNDVPEQRVLAYLAITISVGDIISPTFSEELYQTAVAEGTAPGTSFFTVSATGENPEIEYGLFNLPAGFPFGINDTTGEIFVTSALNREMISLYVFTVRAIDATSGAIGLALVEVTIGDVNDNPPEIQPSLQTISLPEDFPTSTPIIAFVCSDQDVELGTGLSFQITDGNDGSFSISGDGNVELASSLDFETTSSYNVTVVCIDTGDTPLSASATLLVEVTGINEYPPQFANDSYNFTVAEDVGAGDVVGTVSASDRDAGLDGDVRYEIVGGSGVGFFSVNSEGEIRTTTQSLNATAQPTLGLVVRAADRGGLSEDVPVTVIISDINEPPVFSSDSYVAITSTDQPAGTSILDLICFDTDLGDNALLNLAINSNPSNLDVDLQLEGNTGAITASIVLVSPLVAGSYEIILRCSDMGDSPLHTDASVTVRVEGLNTPPMFSHGSISISVPENTATGTSLTTVNATDAETGVEYQITGGNGQGTFTINAANGDISLFLPLDYETTPDYEVTVMAYDEFIFNRLSASTQVFIFVSNINDIPPILSPGGIQVITVNENTSPVEDIKQYTCTDPDGGTVAFSIDPPQGILSPFGITATGTVQLLNLLDFEQVAVYTLTVTCSDQPLGSGDIIRTVSAILIIHVIPENNFAPEFTSPTVFQVLEDAEIGDVVAQVQAIDQDNRGQITYSSSSHTDIFILDQFSGNIVLRQELDYESVRMYVLAITASDNDNEQEGVEERTTTEMLTIQVTDANDNRPLCTSNLETVDLQTGNYTYISLLQLSCSDQDEGMNAELNYTFVESTLPFIPAGEFLLNDTTGQFGFTGTISNAEIIVIDIIVSDLGISPLTTRVTVTIQVESAQAGQPRFVPNRFNITISENTASGTTVLNGMVLQNALQNPDGADVSYSLRDNPEHGGTFIINFASGDIILPSTSLIDFDEGIQEYSLIVEAIVGDNTATAVVLVALTDYNDNPPRFTQSLYETTVAENKQNGTSVFKVEASDIDSNSNGEFMFSIESTLSNDFAIDPVSGEITTLREFDRESTPVISFNVFATDLGTPQQTGSAGVVVIIGDENDLPPQFSTSIYTININNLSPPGAELLTFDILDEDITGSFTFTIITDNPEVRELFTVSSPDGVLRQRSVNVPEDHPFQYNFTVEVNDEIATDTTIVLIYVFSVTSTSTVFEENVENQRYDAQSFILQQGFNITSNANYTISEGDLSNEFAVSADGILTNRVQLDRENIPDYMLTIQVTDTTTFINVDLFIRVVIADQNDNAPVFTMNRYDFLIEEGIYNDRTPVEIVSASDSDEPNSANSRIEYRILVGSPLFSIDPISGQIYIQGLLDRESMEQRTLTIQARDFGGPTSQATLADVVVTLTDINDNRPQFIPFGVIEFLVFVPDSETPAGTTLTMITAILSGTGGTQLSVPGITMFEYTDADSSSLITSTLEAIVGENKYQLSNINGNPNRQLLNTTENVMQADDGTILQLTLRDAIDDEDPVSINITILVANTTGTPPTSQTTDTPTTATTTESTTSSTENFFQTELGIAVLVVFGLLIVALVFFLCCLCCYCYLRFQREKDPLRNRDRMVTVAQRLRTETDRKGRKAFGRPWEYYGYGDIDQLEFPEFSPEDPETQFLYGAGHEFESSFMGDYEAEMGGYPFQSPSTGTSMLSYQPEIVESDPELETDSGARGYSMGPVLQAMLGEWEAGDELLKKDKKKSRSKLSLNKQS